MVNTVVISYIYPNAERFFGSFLESLKNQDLEEFDIILFNDNCSSELLQSLPEYVKIINIEAIDIPSVRFESLKILKRLHYSNIIFCDIDDTFSSNRVKVSKQKLEIHPIVFNDLNILNNELIVTEKNIWSSRLLNNTTIDYDFLKQKNTIGLGNSAIKKSLLNDVEFLTGYNKVIATDWLIFSQLLGVTKNKAIFTNECQSNYRQYGENIAGLSKKINHKIIERTINVKNLHYKLLNENGYNFTDEIIELSKQKRNNILEIELDFYPFWWEQNNLI